jgi:hypothetical protein
VATGVHRPFTATALTMRATPDEPPLVLVGDRRGWWQSGADEWLVRSGVLEELGVDEVAA